MGPDGAKLWATLGAQTQINQRSCPLRNLLSAQRMYPHTRGEGQGGDKVGAVAESPGLVEPHASHGGAHSQPLRSLGAIIHLLNWSICAKC